VNPRRRGQGHDSLSRGTRGEGSIGDRDLDLEVDIGDRGRAEQEWSAEEERRTQPCRHADRTSGCDGAGGRDSTRGSKLAVCGSKCGEQGLSHGWVLSRLASMADGIEYDMAPERAQIGEVAKFLVECGFVYHSLSDVVREEASARGLDHSRENLIRVGNELRTTFGPGILAERVASRIREKSRDIVDSIRSPFEVEVLRRLPRFVLLGVDAPIATRFERSRARARIGDGSTLEEFSRKESLENSSNPAAQQLTRTFSLSDVVVDNSGSLDDLRVKVRAALGLQGT
jgi:dephospho-CoA kinase